MAVDLKVNPEYAAIWGDLPRAELEALKESIRIDGLYEKIVVNPDLVILDGHNRYYALQDLGVPIDESVYEIRDFGDPLEEHLYIIRSQINRRHATPYHRVENAIPLLDIEKAKAGDRRTANLPNQPNDKYLSFGRSTEAIGDLVGLSHTTVEKALYIVEHGDVIKGLKDKLRWSQNSPSIDNAYRQVREIVEPRPTPVMPEGVYDVIYADPPWEYDFKLRGSPDDHYPTMKTDEICELKVPAAENAILFLWATNPKLEDALKVATAWGFTYKTNLVWVKDLWGTGYYFRGQHELLLLATKGEIQPPPISARRSSVLHASRAKHSEKPEEVYEIIEAMYPGYTYLELFARNEREGWKAWGLEVNG